MNNWGRPAEYIGPISLKDLDWHFRLYLMKGDQSEIVARAGLLDLASSRARRLVTQCLSSEFPYIRSGFIIAHYGRRGVTYSYWYWGNWGGTWEAFCQAWYCYGRDLEKMDPIDRTDPILCHYEIDIVTREAKAMSNILTIDGDIDRVTAEYRLATV